MPDWRHVPDMSEQNGINAAPHMLHAHGPDTGAGADFIRAQVLINMLNLVMHAEINAGTLENACVVSNEREVACLR